MSARTPIQSNVQDFDEILSGSEAFATPRNSLSSSYMSFGSQPAYKATKPIHGSPLRISESYQYKSPDRPSVNLLCNPSSKCNSSETRSLEQSPLTSPALTQPDQPDRSLTGSNIKHAVESFQPEFIADYLQKMKMTKTEQNKWETVRTITETIIKEKDMLIERQKLKRLQLEQQVRDLETKLRKMVLAQISPSESALKSQKSSLEIEEQAYKQMVASVNCMSDNASLAKVVMEKSQLERQLGEAEHKVAELKCKILTVRSDMQQQIDYYKKQLDLSHEQEQALKSKNQSLTSEESHASKELSRLKLYLADLPTQEEYEILKNTLDGREGQLTSCNEHISILEEEKYSLVRTREDLESELNESKDQVDQLLHQVSVLQKEVSAWEDNELLRSTATEDDIITLKEKHKILYEDYEKISKLLDSRDKKLELVNREHEKQQSDLRERLQQHESLVQAAEQECNEKDNQIELLKSSIKQLKQENQDLIEKTISWESKIEAAEKVVSSESSRLEQTLVEDIVYCTNSLECLVEMCDNPKNLDLADMLATRPTPVTISSPREYVSIMKQQSSSLKSINEKIEKLRQFILDKYADDMASSGHIECATQ